LRRALHRARSRPAGQRGIFAIDGNQLPQAPKWTVNGTLGYELPVGAGALYAFTTGTIAPRSSSSFMRASSSATTGFWRAGLRLGYRTDRFDVAAFARNITNDVSAVGGVDFNNLTAFVNEPRIFGLEAGIKF
jgi:iron complex outermembrane receptor protein